jgi:hypothetical protein
VGTGRRKYDVPAIVALVLVVLAIACFRSEFRLQFDMPHEFFDARQVAKEKRASEEKIARAYWNCAVKQVQWKYGYAHRLPEAPPDEFLLNESEIGAAARDQALRRHYWQQLHTAWNMSSVWQTRWEFSFLAFRQSLQTGGEWWKELVRSVVGE